MTAGPDPAPAGDVHGAPARDVPGAPARDVHGAPARNVADLVRLAADGAGDRAAFVTGESSLTWRAADAHVDALAADLRRRGLTAGDRVGLLLPNGPEFAVTYFAVLRAGLVAVPLNTAYTAAELDYQLSDASARLVVTDDQLAARVGDRPTLSVQSTQWHSVFDPTASGQDGAGRPATEASAPASGDDLAVLLYTSGTTGRPKGAMLSHGALLANLDQLAHINPPVVVADDVVLLVLPLFHVYGLNAGLGLTAHAAATGLLVDRFDPVESLELVRSRGVTAIIGAPPMYVAWSMLPELRDSLASVRLAVSGAAPLPPAVLDEFRSVTGHVVYEGYGLTETAPVLTTTLCSASPKAGSIGRPVPGVELRLIDEAGEQVDEDDPGEIAVRGPNLFSGYWPDGSGGPDGDGWFATGDVAYADADGDLFLVDRIRDLILVSGFNVFPREVEDVIASNPDVAEVAVVGAPHPYTGETVRALVVPKPGAHPTPESVITHASARLARFKCPTSVELVDELPHSVIGKVAKGRLREQ